MRMTGKIYAKVMARLAQLHGACATNQPRDIISSAPTLSGRTQPRDASMLFGKRRVNRRDGVP
jgi:hypothetical protein